MPTYEYVCEKCNKTFTLKMKVAEREKADLIAMASHGRSGISRVFYGSVTSGVMQRVDRPLLLIRSRQA